MLYLLIRSMQEVQLDKHVKLLDSPGIVMAQGNSDAATILRNCVKVKLSSITIIGLRAQMVSKSCVLIFPFIPCTNGLSFCVCFRGQGGLTCTALHRKLNTQQIDVMYKCIVSSNKESVRVHRGRVSSVLGI